MNQNRFYRRLSAILPCLLLFSALTAQIRLAAWGGVHASNLLEKNSIPGYDTSNGKYFTSRTGFELGVLTEIPLGKHNLFLQPGLLYSAKGNQYEKIYDTTFNHSDTLYNQHTLSLNYVEIPVFLTWKTALSKNQENHFYISAGPYFAFIYSASESYQNQVQQFNSPKYLYQSGTIDLPVGNGSGSYKTLDMGIAAKAGFELGNVMIGAYYSRGLTNAYSAAYPASFHNQVFGGSLGIWLNKVKTVAEPVKDYDKDGIPDAEDSCKTIAGSPRWHGCPIPDSDHDGINDEEDSCKYVPGSRKYHGCPVPDSDLDGINDEEDSCKYLAGTVKYHGCPVPDRDLDGVNDELDRCPDQPGQADNQGCPVLKAAINKRAELVAASVMFNTNSTQLTKSSYSAIRELADSLKANPDLNLLIEGHTDDIGKSDYNLKLSKERAESVKKLLIVEGISKERIQVKGLGDSQPVADNSSVEGRAKNRRVLFVFELKNR
jgi:OmpA-OmpF porin, OOP family